MTSSLNPTTNLTGHIGITRLGAYSTLGIALLLAGLSPAQARAGGDLNGEINCAADRPCLNQLSQNGTTAVVGWDGHQNYNHYNFRWSGPGHPESQSQIDGGSGGSASFTVEPASTYTVKVQGCNVDITGHSTCSSWDEGFFTSRSGYGATGCKQGFVWRGANPNDHVCVTPQTRDETAAQNAQGPALKDPNGAYGPNSCKQGFVWRDAYPGDVVCVTPAARDQAAADNAAGPSRVAG